MQRHTLPLEKLYLHRNICQKRPELRENLFNKKNLMENL